MLVALVVLVELVGLVGWLGWLAMLVGNIGWQCWLAWLVPYMYVLVELVGAQVVLAGMCRPSNTGGVLGRCYAEKVGG